MQIVKPSQKLLNIYWSPFLEKYILNLKKLPHNLKNLNYNLNSQDKSEIKINKEDEMENIINNCLKNNINYKNIILLAIHKQRIKYLEEK